MNGPCLRGTAGFLNGFRIFGTLQTLVAVEGANSRHGLNLMAAYRYDTLPDGVEEIDRQELLNTTS